MRKVNYTWQNLKTWLALVLLGVSAIGYSQATFTGANFNIPLAAGATSGAASGTVGVACVGQIANGANITLSVNFAHTFVGDLNMWLTAPSGQVLELSTRNGGGNNNMNVVFSDAGANNIASIVSTASTGIGCPTTTNAYSGTLRPEGRNNVITAFNVAPSNVPAVGTFTFANTFSGVNANGNWTLTIDDGVGGDAGNTCAWSISFAGVPAPAACTFVGGPVLPTLNLSTAVDNCVGVPVAVPATQGDCAGAVVQASVNGGAFAPVVGPTIPGLPVGANTIVWRVTNACLQVSTATQTVNVADLVPPVITCPANIVINLDAGECCAFVNYNVTATDNCPSFGPVASAQFPTTILPHGGGAITVAGNNAPGGFFFNLTNTSGGPVQVTGYQVRFGSSQFGVVPSPRTVNTYYTTTATTFAGNTGNAGAWTSSGAASVTVAGPNSEFSQVNLSAPFTLAAGATKGIYLFGTQSSLVYNGAAGYVATVTQGILTANFGSSSTGLFGGTIANRTGNVVVQYRASLAAPPITQTAGSPSGSEFCVGTTTNCFTATDNVGLTASCCFDVVIREYANPSQQMACNDNVQISLDQNCEAVIGADDILEGGLYGCYDTRYSTMIITPMGGIISGPNGEAIVDASYIGGPHTVKVTDVVTGQSCWGTIMVKDKLPPVIECRDIVIPCTVDPATINEPAPALVGPQAIIYDGLNDIIENGAGTSPRNYNFDFSYIPAGIPVLDANVRVKLTGHTFLPDLVMTLIAPDGTSRRIFGLTGCTGAEWDIDVIWDDEGSGGLTACAALNAGGANLQCLELPGVQNPNVLNFFDGKDASGTWTLRIEDTFAADDGIIEEVGVILEVNAPAIVPTDNCSNVTLTHFDSYVDAGTCDAGQITRTWTATDDWENAASCVQIITIERPTLDDVIPPADVMWTCEQYDAFPNVTGVAALHPFIRDADPATSVIEVNLDPNCDDLDLNLGTPVTQDNPAINATNTANGGLGCPGSNPFFGNNGLDDADVLAHHRLRPADLRRLPAERQLRDHLGLRRPAHQRVRRHVQDTPSLDAHRLVREPVPCRRVRPDHQGS
ncbi:MAG: proprotein convertase P-domain-containing protein [Saprospiraceae bacterium]|nr:proprotein convertase P-domain-containing protein [Saprospiraceae bacterium]